MASLGSKNLEFIDVNGKVVDAELQSVRSKRGAFALMVFRCIP
jgi:hypothetical protein